jgi:hypothetical protein
MSLGISTLLFLFHPKYATEKKRIMMIPFLLVL